jgi:hypothetical protein
VGLTSRFQHQLSIWFVALDNFIDNSWLEPEACSQIEAMPPMTVKPAVISPAAPHWLTIALRPILTAATVSAWLGSPHHTQENVL